ncbi:interleukin-18 receptor accessory protein-like isoform X2 [Cololabis saira]|uniref:interleukin-18 receptor accessory protein-like isoform X2 n=1 Tax=Cololabis saira TaxID=129043 RepID=UPI002AD24E28|nr:interleukin-18 receptor accessory protein-like isoform X2 [Cololabis saira]
MKLSSVVKALGSLCLLIVDGSPVSMEEFPEIIGPKHVCIKACPGKPLVLHCDAFTTSSNDETLIYWLVNDLFPEDAQNQGRIVESNESSLEEGLILQKSLLLKKVTSEDLKSTFSCIVSTAGGMAQKSIKLVKTTSPIKGKKRSSLR